MFDTILRFIVKRRKINVLLRRRVAPYASLTCLMRLALSTWTRYEIITKHDKVS